MTLPEVIKRIKSAPNFTPAEVRVGTLLWQLGLNFIAAGKKIETDSGRALGEIDLIFSDPTEHVLFLIEVSTQARNTSQKVDHFFSKWSDTDNIKVLKKRLVVTGRKVYRLNIDVSTKTRELSASLDHVLQPGKNNILLNEKDLTYFEEAFQAVGLWARNDLYNFLGIQPGHLTSKLPAIVFYIGEQRAFVYADHVENILQYSYVYRRREHDKGYQRMVQQNRIGSIAKTIGRKKTITFPNSIILNSQQKLTNLEFTPEDCPAPVEVDIPKSFCHFRVIDGQHRLLGFAKMGEYARNEYILPVVILENLAQSKEVQTFIEINHKQKKLDTNLILTLKKDFNWRVEEPEFFERISVLIAERLNNNSALKGQIFFGFADEKKGRKITVATLHSVIKKNRLTGLTDPLYQKDPYDDQTPYLRIKEIFSHIIRLFGKENFFMSNKGLRILFRLLQLYERNIVMGHVAASREQFIDALHQVFSKPNFRKSMEEFYGEGGARAAAVHITEQIREVSDDFDNMQSDLRSL